MKEPNSILIEQQPINNLYLNDIIDGLGIHGQGIRNRLTENIRFENHLLFENKPALREIQYVTSLDVDELKVGVDSCLETHF